MYVRNSTPRSRGRVGSVARLALAGVLAGGFALPHVAEACTRLLYTDAAEGAKGAYTGRSMDWMVDTETNLWIFPRGMKRTGLAGKNGVTWTSKYGSITASAFHIATSDGMNEKGLVANLLWLAQADFPAEKNDKPELSVGAWAQYALDNFATVAEAVEALSKQPFTIVTGKIPDTDTTTTVHLALSDPSGDSAIIEYLGGKQVIHHGPQYPVMTNSPPFGQQLALEAYWKQIGGTVFLPGTNRASDRFARAAFYVGALPKFKDPNMSVAGVFSVVRNVSVPLGITTPGEPNIASTRWRAVSDQERLFYFFESALTPNTFWVDLNKADLSAETGKPMVLELGPNQDRTFSGDAIKKFKVAKPFKFLGT